MSAAAELMPLVARALETAGVAASDGVVAACSHGPDSLALAALLIALRPGRVVVACVDHGLRPDSAEEAERVRAFAIAAGATAAVARVTVVNAGEGLEAAARAARLAALERIADEHGARWIALGHHAADQSETVLGHLVRGSGVAGLAGMAPVRGRLIRPLLGVDRSLLERYLLERSLTPSRDPMNEDRRFLRARLRHEHLPALRRENPRLDEAVGRMASSLRELEDALAWMAERAASETGVVSGEGETRLDAAALARWPAAVQKRLLARLAASHGASLEARHLEALVALAARPDAGSVAMDLPRGLEVRREYGTLVLGRTLPGPVGLRIAAAGGPYMVRTWQAGDRMRPAQLRGRSRKLQDLFTDRKVPAALRPLARVVVRIADGAIVWAEHVGPAFDAPETQVTLTRGDPAVIYD